MAEDMLVPATLPMRPWDYIKRRRLLAGLSIEQAARPFWHRPEHRADTERNVARAEQQGVTLRPYQVPEVLRAFNIDVDVYRQLQDLPIFHPRLCRCCASTDMEPRETFDGASATITADGICTACHEDLARRAARRAA